MIGFKTFSTSAVAFAFVAASAAASFAATFNFDAANSGGWKNSLVYNDAGITLTVTGKSTDGSAAKVATWAGWGLGVCNVLEQLARCPSWDDQHAIDSRYILEDVAILTFNKVVTLKKLVFNNLGNTNTFDLYLDDDGWTEVLSGQAESGTWTPSADYTSISFGVGAGTTKTTVLRRWSSWFCRWEEKTIYSAFKLRSVEVDEPAPVPLPAAGLMLLTAMGGLAAAKRRKAA